MPLIVKKSDSGIIIIHPNNEKYGPELKEFYEDRLVNENEEYEDYETYEDYELETDSEGNEKIITVEKQRKVLKTRVVQVKKSFLVKTIRPYSECKALQPYIEQGFEWFWQDEQVDKSDIESRKQLYHDGNQIKKDLSWEIKLMPDQLIKKKHTRALNAELEIHLSNNDTLNALKKQREIEKIKDIKAGPHNEDSFWLQKSLDGLSRASIDKPIIRKKLQDKIAELSGETVEPVVEEKKVVKAVRSKKNA